MTRKAHITSEHFLEAQRLRKIWDETPNKPSQVVFGEKFSIGNQSAVGQFLNGKLPLSMKAAVGFAKGLGCNISDFSPRLALEIVEGSRLISGEAVPHELDFAGRGGNVQAVRVTGEIWIDDEVSVSSVQNGGYVVGSGVEDGYAVRVRGDGANPAIKDGQFLVVERFGDPAFSDYCIVQTAAGETIIAEFLARRDDGYTFESLGNHRRYTLRDDEVSQIDGVVAVVSSRRWRADPTPDMFTKEPVKPGN